MYVMYIGLNTYKKSLEQAKVAEYGPRVISI